MPFDAALCVACPQYHDIAALAELARTFKTDALADGLKSRKLPSQARSVVTVEAIFEATIQVLLGGRARVLTANRVAEKAGVSVGTLYQYFPGKETLLYALVSRHLDRASTAVEVACEAQHRTPLTVCSDTFVNAYVDAKIGNPEASRALYHASMEINMQDLGATMIARLHSAAEQLLGCALDAQFEALDGVVFSWVAVVTGGTRQIFEQDHTIVKLPVFREQLLSMSRAYLAAACT